MLPIDISHIILRELKDKLENYQHIKQVLLQRFKLSAESFRMKFSTHQKQHEALWKDFAYELKKRVANEVQEHFVDIWGDIRSSSELVQKLDDYEVARGKTSNHKILPDELHWRTVVQVIRLQEKLYTILLQQGAAFEKTVVSLSFADRIVNQKEVLRTFQTVILEGRKFKTPFIILPDAKNNSTLLGVDFLENAGIVLNFRKICWTFWDDFRKSYNFVTPYHSTSVNVRPVAINNCQLREDEGQELLGSQRAELDSLLRNHHSIFEVGGEATPFIEHSINTENNPPISVPPYRKNPVRKELLKKELDSLLQQGIIVECESPYSSPVALIPKPNGSMRLCIDYRKLNAQTFPDSYPLPRMDDLLNEAKPTPYMSTIDLLSGYHQVKVAAEDRDKTAFTCPFGIYKSTRMPFGLRNAPATFQRLIDKFRSGLNNVLVLSYLDDIIILSPTFQKQLSDLEQIFKRLSLFKLNANREKFNLF
ncbi:retrovirus-related Pol polyprotein from transposon 297 [Trichonephila clavipes]|nr:retrovirus-related Pol polyprotein from transposon 297 [Trichonephila clavipes]